MGIEYNYDELKTLFNTNLTRDNLRSCARQLGLNPVGLKKDDLENMIIAHILKWRLVVPKEFTVMHRKPLGRPKKTKIHIQTQT